MTILFRKLYDKHHGKGNYFRQLVAYRDQLLEYRAKQKKQGKRGRPHHPMFLHSLVSVFFDSASAFYFDMKSSKLYKDLSPVLKKRLDLFHTIAHVISCLSIFLKHRTRSAAFADPALAECWKLIEPVQDPKEKCARMVFSCDFFFSSLLKFFYL